MQSAPGITELYTDGRYLENNQTWHSEDSPWKALQIENILAKNNVKPVSVCEVGCGAGEILRRLSLKTTDTHYFGYELSPQAFELCKSRESATVHFFQSDIRADDRRYDLLLCIDVFEHVEDYFSFLRSIKPKAAMTIFHIPLDITALTVARGRMIAGRKSVGHIHYYTRESALATLRDCGYEVLDESYTRYFDYLKARSAKQWIIHALQRVAFRVSPHLSVRLLGGCALLVLAR